MIEQELALFGIKDDKKNVLKAKELQEAEQAEEKTTEVATEAVVAAVVEEPEPSAEPATEDTK